MRILDLFHITDDRTPFALWRFVSPSDKRSAEEWKKHRALHGVALVDFPPGYAIRVQGFTENEEVWAGLQDLRRYCESQIQGVLDISARHVPQRYGLKFLRLDWAVTTGHLRPFDFRFEFDRTAMFRILSDDIYDGDPYVFLRELLQNAIDAIRIRNARHTQRSSGGSKKKASPPTFDTTIYFAAEHKTNGDIQVTCRDFGIGMDEHIIRNYLTVAGVSYYRSLEFERQHLGFEPISRFGIGILSCFMVADKVRIRTYRDPECGPPLPHADLQLPSAEEHRSRRLSLEIPGVQRQFVVKDLSDNFAVGTEVQVNVLAQKARKPRLKKTASDFLKEADSKPVFKRNLKITEYLSEIAGFVEFPILIEETWPGQLKAKTTLIVHPDRDAKSEKVQYTGDVDVCQLSRGYSWEDVFEKQDIASARKSLTEHSIELGEILAGEGYEGWIVFPKPLNERWDFSNRESRFDYGSNQLFWRERTNGKVPAPAIRWLNEEHVIFDAKTRRPLFAVYRDGILLPGISELEDVSVGTMFPLPSMRINLSGTRTPVTNVARTDLKSNKNEWQKTMWDAVEKCFAKSVQEALLLDPLERIIRLSWLKIVYGLKTETLKNWVQPSKIVTVWLLPGTKLEVREGMPDIGQEIPLVPVELQPLINEIASNSLFSLPLSKEPQLQWEGSASLVTGGDVFESALIESALDLSDSFLSKHYIATSIQFLEAPEELGGKVSQHVATVHSVVPDFHDYYANNGESEWEQSYRKALLRNAEIREALLVARSRPESLKPRERHLLHEVMPVNSYERIGIPVSFTCPFASVWGSSDGYINALHPLGLAVIRSLAECCIAEADDTVSSELYRKLTESAERARINNRQTGPTKFVEELFSLITRYKLVEGFVAPKLPKAKELLQIGGREAAVQMRPWGEEYDLSKVKGSCGKVIKG